MKRLLLQKKRVKYTLGGDSGHIMIPSIQCNKPSAIYELEHRVPLPAPSDKSVWLPY